MPTRENSKEKYAPDELTAFFNFDAAQARELEPPPSMDNAELIDILEEIQRTARALDTTKDFVYRTVIRASISRRVAAHLESKGFEIVDAGRLGWSISWGSTHAILSDEKPASTNWREQQ